MKILIKILGIGFIIGGVLSFANLFNVGGFTTNIYTLIFRLLIALAYIGTGYGLLNLKRWSLYVLGAMIGLDILTNFYNLYFTKAPQNSLDFNLAAVHLVFFLILFSLKDKLLQK